MTHAFTTNLGLNYFHTTFFAHHTPVTKALVFSTNTLVVLHWAEDLGTEETISLRLQRPVVNGLWLGNLTK
jgi:hypothetical protein